MEIESKKCIVNNRGGVDRVIDKEENMEKAWGDHATQIKRVNSEQVGVLRGRKQFLARF